MNKELSFEFFPEDGKTIDFVGMSKSIYLSPLIQSMFHCIQEKKYHEEEDVWTHTQMCLINLLESQNYMELTKEQQKILFIATLLHDSGKPITTKTEGSIISSKGHSVKGARLARESIINWNNCGFTNIPFEAREQICNLILLHMLPIYLLEKADPVFSASSSSMVIQNKLLAILSIADTEGRICSVTDKKTAKERIELFVAFCEENKCYESKFPFVSDMSRFRYFFEHKGHPNYDYFEPICGEAIVMCGLQASGKDYVIRNNYQDRKIISLDQTRIDMDLDFGDDEDAVVKSAKEKCRECMRNKVNFVFNATNLIKDVRSKWIRLFRQYKYSITIHYKERPLTTILEANKNREHKVPESVILEKVKKIDVPTLMECHKLILEVE